MRRGQTSIEIVLGTTLLALILSVGALTGLTSWRGAERSLAQLAAARAASRGGDPVSAARQVVPSMLWQSTRPASTPAGSDR